MAGQRARRLADARGRHGARARRTREALAKTATDGDRAARADRQLAAATVPSWRGRSARWSALAARSSCSPGARSDVEDADRVDAEPAGRLRASTDATRLTRRARQRRHHGGPDVRAPAARRPAPSAATAGGPARAEFLQQGGGEPAADRRRQSAVRRRADRRWRRRRRCRGRRRRLGGARGSSAPARSRPRRCRPRPSPTSASTSTRAASQKIEALKTLKSSRLRGRGRHRAPTTTCASQSSRRSTRRRACEDLDYDDDIEPWLGDRVAVAAVDLGDDEPDARWSCVQVNDAGQGRGRAREARRVRRRPADEPAAGRSTATGP